MKILILVFFVTALSVPSAFAENLKDRIFELDAKKEKLGTCTLILKSMFNEKKNISVTQKKSCKKHSVGSVYYKHQDGTIRPMNPLK